MTLPSGSSDPAPASPLAPPLGVFRHRDFSLFWASRVLATLGVMCQSVTLGWQVYAIARSTHSVDQSAFLVGMVGLAQFGPLFLLTLFAGEATDRYDRKIIMVACLCAQFICDVGLAILAANPHATLTPIFLIAGVFGAARAFPADSALAPMLVPRAELPSSVAWSSLAWQVASVIGPVLAGILVAVSPMAAYIAAAGLYLGAAALSAMIRGQTKPEFAGGRRLAQIREGLVYVWRDKVVLGALSLDLFAVLLGGTTALLPVFAKDVLHAGPAGFGLLRAGDAVGACVASFLLSRRPLKRRAGLWMFGGVAAFAVATIVFALSKSLALSIGALVILGAGDMVSVYIRLILVQVATPDAMRGRVSAISSVFVGGSNELGEFETGLMARWLGPVGAALFGGVGCIVIIGVWAGLFPQLRRADRLLSD